MLIVNKNYSHTIARITPQQPPPIPNYINNNTESKLELTVSCISPRRLPTGYTTIIAACVYIPEWAENKQRSAIFKLITALETAVTDYSKNGRPLIIINLLCATIKQAENTMQPLKVLRLKGDKPWMNVEIKTLI